MRSVGSRDHEAVDGVLQCHAAPPLVAPLSGLTVAWLHTTLSRSSFTPEMTLGPSLASCSRLAWSPADEAQATMHPRHGEELVAAKFRSTSDPPAMTFVDLEGFDVPEEDLAEIRGREEARISPPETRVTFRNNFMTQYC